MDKLNIMYLPPNLENYYQTNDLENIFLDCARFGIELSIYF